MLNSSLPDEEDWNKYCEWWNNNNQVIIKDKAGQIRLNTGYEVMLDKDNQYVIASVYPLVGSALLAEVKEHIDLLTTADIARKCGYSSQSDNGSVVLNYIEFYVAFLCANGINIERIESSLESIDFTPTKNKRLIHFPELEFIDKNADKAEREKYNLRRLTTWFYRLLLFNFKSADELYRSGKAEDKWIDFQSLVEFIGLFSEELLMDDNESSSKVKTGVIELIKDILSNDFMWMWYTNVRLELSITGQIVINDDGTTYLADQYEVCIIDGDCIIKERCLEVYKITEEQARSICEILNEARAKIDDESDLISTVIEDHEINLETKEQLSVAHRLLPKNKDIYFYDLFATGAFEEDESRELKSSDPSISHYEIAEHMFARDRKN